ncbi:MAG: DUF4169 family protein [Robiginitomaculum sp.]
MTDKTKENIISFRKAKKPILRGRKENKAEQNRVKFGRTKAQKRIDDFEKDKAVSRLDGRKLDDESQ